MGYSGSEATGKERGLFNTHGTLELVLSVFPLVFCLSTLPD